MRDAHFKRVKRFSLVVLLIPIFLKMLSTEGFVHVAVLCAITIIIVTEIRASKDPYSWLPILTTVVGYLLPQPKFRKTKTSKKWSASTIHMDPDFAPSGEDIGADEVDGAVASNTDTILNTHDTPSTNWKTIIADTMPSLAILVAVGIWTVVTIFSYGGDSQLSAIANSTLTESQRAHYPTETSISSGATVDLCNDDEFYLLNGRKTPTGEIWLECVGDNIHLMFANNISRLQLDHRAWKYTLFRIGAISHRLHGERCSTMTIGLKNQTVLACNNRVTIDGYPDVVTLTDRDWNELIYRVPEISLAMQHNCCGGAV